MNAIKKFFAANWPQILSLMVGLTVILWLVGCPPRAASPINPEQKLTLPELNVELQHLLEQYELKALEIEEQEAIRQVLIKNALLIAETGTINPLGILTGLLALYGAGSAANSTKNVIKKKRPPVE